MDTSRPAGMPSLEQHVTAERDFDAARSAENLAVYFFMLSPETVSAALGEIMTVLAADRILAVIDACMARCGPGAVPEYVAGLEAAREYVAGRRAQLV